MDKTVTNVVIIGGGFAGVRTALALARSSEAKNLHITLLSNRPHFEYQPAIYRLAVGGSPFEVCIPLDEIFKGTNVAVIVDKMVSIDKSKKAVMAGSGASYAYDKLVIAIGAEVNYFGIPGLAEHAYSMKTIAHAVEIKKGIEATLLACKNETDKVEQVCDAHFIIVGGGATGVELAGELAPYARERALVLGVDPNLITVDLVEAAPRILPLMPEWFSLRVEKHLRRTGVNIFTSRSVTRQEVEETFLKDMQMRAKTVIWTSGVKAHGLYASIGMPLDPRGRVVVDEQLHPHAEDGSMEDIYVGGDGAATKSSGFAQTAYHDGEFIAKAILAEIRGHVLPVYKPLSLSYAMPAGPKWAAVLIGNIGIFSRLGWYIRRAADFRALNAILPFKKAYHAWRYGRAICDDCVVCNVYTK